MGFDIISNPRRYYTSHRVRPPKFDLSFPLKHSLTDEILVFALGDEFFRFQPGQNDSVRYLYFPVGDQFREFCAALEKQLQHYEGDTVEKMLVENLLQNIRTERKSRGVAML